MILQDALCNLKSSLMETGYFNRFYEYVHQVKEGVEVTPQYYNGKGGYIDVYNFDVNGSGYIRKTGAMNLTDSGLPQVTSCSEGDIVNVNYPLRAVFAVPRTKLNDNAFAEDQLALDLMAAISNEATAITNVSEVSFNTTSYKTDRLQIWKEEIQGIEHQMNFKLAYVAIDFTLTLTTTIGCLTADCASYGSSTPVTPVTPTCDMTGLEITSGNYTLDPDTITVVLITDASHIVFLPDPSEFIEGQKYTFKDGTGAAGTNNLTLRPASGKNFEGLAADDDFLLVDDGQTVVIFSDQINTYWFDNSE